MNIEVIVDNRIAGLMFDEAVREFARAEGQQVYPGAYVDLAIYIEIGAGAVKLEPGVQVETGSGTRWKRLFRDLDALSRALAPFVKEAGK